MSLLLTFWREALIAVLMLALVAAGHYGLSKRDELLLAEAEFSRQVIQANSAVEEVKTRSERTLHAINDKHQTVVASAEKNAVKNYQARYGALGCGVGAVRLPNDAAMPSNETGPDHSTSNPDDSGTGIVAVDAGLVRTVQDCAIDASTIGEFQAWVRGNRLPVEGE